MDDPDSAMQPTEKHSGPIEWMVRNPVAANLLMIILIVGGLFMATQVQKEVYPSFELDVINIQVGYPGASPEEVERGVLQPVEDSVRGVRGIREMTSRAYEGAGYITLELVSGIDRMKAYQEINQSVERIRTFPSDAEKPNIWISAEQSSVLNIQLFGGNDRWALRQHAELLIDTLISAPEISQVELNNAPDYVTHVEISQENLRRYGLTHQSVANLIEGSSQDIPAGTLDTTNGEVLLRMKERKQWAGELESVVIAQSDSGGIVTLGDIATVHDGFEEQVFPAQFNKKFSISINVYRVGDQSPLEIASAVERVLEDFSDQMPAGLEYHISGNQAEDFKDRLNLLLKNGGLAIIIVLIILGLFLQYQLAFWIMAGMTISFVGAILFLPAVDISINMVSMFAFLVVLGIVVDDAVVVGENIYEYQQQGHDYLSAAILGAKSIAGPVTFSILTTIVAFAPVMLIPGATGKFWWPFPVVVIIVLLLSLLEALYILPAHLAYIKEKQNRGLGGLVHRRQRHVAQRFNQFIEQRYRPFIRACLHHRQLSLSVAFSLLIIVSAFAASGHMGMVMMPQSSADEIEAGVRLPVGTTREQAAKVANDITEATYRMFEEHDLYTVAEGIKSNVRGKSFIDVEIVMRPPDERDMSALDVIELWREQIGDIDGVDRISFQAERGPGGWRDDISVDLSHANSEILQQASERFMAEMARYPNAKDIKDSISKGRKQYSFTLLPQAYTLGLTPEEVGRQIRGAYFGAVAFRQLRDTNEVEVRVRFPESQRVGSQAINNFLIRTPSGAEVPLLEVAELSIEDGYGALNRRDGRRIVNVGMDVDPQNATSRVLAAVQEDVLPELRREFPGLTWSFRGSQADLRSSTELLKVGFLMALFIIYALLAVAFKSYIQPIIVMISIPFGIIGVVFGHLLLGYDLSLISLMGAVALSGVVVNGALILIDYANKRRAELSAFDAILEASVRRFRPIFLTTLTTFGGLTPIILESSRQAAYLIPMAISLGFGILFATAIILVVVPCFYLVVEDIKKLSWARDR